MGATYEELVHRVTLIDDYTAKMNKIADSTDTLDKKWRGAKVALEGASAFLGGIGIAAAVATPAVLGLAAAMAKLTADAIKEDTKMQGIGGTLANLYGSQEIADQKLAWLKRFALDSSLQFDDLAEAAVKLRAVDISPERTLQTEDRFIKRMRGGKEELEELTRAYMRLAGGPGSYGEALEILREKFGITRKVLESEGIKFDGNGQALASREQMFLALERISKRGSQTDFNANSNERKFSNLEDAYSQMLARMGLAWREFVGSSLDGLIRVFNAVTNSGVLEQIVTKMQAVLGMILGKDPEERLLRLTALGLAWVQQMIDNVGIFVGMIQVSVNWIDKSVTFLYNSIGKGFFAMIETIAIGMMPLLNVLSLFSKEAKDLRDALKTMQFKPIDSLYNSKLGGRIGAFAMGVNPDKAEEIYQKLKGYKNDGANVPGSNDLFTDQGKDKAEKETAENTRKTAALMQQMVDFRRNVLGGGELAAMGVTPVELYGGRSGRGKAIDINLQGVEGQMAGVVGLIVQQTILSLKRQGAI